LPRSSTSSPSGSLSRRDFLQRSSLLGAAALVSAALPVAEQLGLPQRAAADPTLDDATLQAFADTVIPGRRVDRTESGAEVHPKAIAGVDPQPGAVEADALAVFHSPLIGFDALEPTFLADLSLRSLPHGGDFLDLPFDARVQVLVGALDFQNPSRVVYEAAAAVPFTAFCAAALHPFGNAQNASGYRVMGYPGGGPNNHPIMYPYSFSYRRRLAKERTKRGYLR
jgi:hypothetical protein